MKMQSKADDSADEETIRLALKKYGVTVPDNAEFTPEGKGQYTFDVWDVTLGYSLDSKGFYQPVYEFDAQVDGNKVVIAIPALEWQGYCVKTSKITRSTAKSGGHD